MKNITISFLLLFISFNSFAINAFDLALNQVSSDLAKKLITKGKKKIVVLYITDINKSTTVAGKYLADNVSYNFVNDSSSFVVFNREYLDEIADVKKLIDEKYISADKVQEIGRILSVEAIITGTYTILSNTIKLNLKALDVNNGFLIAAAMKDLPLDADAGALLGINISTNEGNNNNMANRGFNGTPLNSSEQMNNPGTVSKECEAKNMGDYCFNNTTKNRLTIILYIGESQGGPILSSWTSEITVEPGQTQCFTDLAVTKYGYIIRVVSTGWTRTMEEINQDRKGNVIVEKCKSKTFAIK
jgi:hypothetical protein